jgi:2-oxoglutarate dehydrogenase E1 component
LPAAGSSLEELTSGGFQAVIDDVELEDAGAVQRIVFCSGKVFYDLADARKKATSEALNTVAIVRVEQLYPFPVTAIKGSSRKIFEPETANLVSGRAEEYGWLDFHGR